MERRRRAKAVDLAASKWLSDTEAALEQPFSELEQVVRAERPQHLPVVFTAEEVQRVLGELSGVHEPVANDE